MIPANVKYITCLTNTNEVIQVPVSLFTSSSFNLEDGIVPQAKDNELIPSGIEIGIGGQVKLNSYTSLNAFSGTPIGLLAYDESGRLVSYPLVSNQQAQQPIQQTSTVEFEFDGTPYMLPMFSSEGLVDTDIKATIAKNYSVGGGNPAMFKWDVRNGSINIDQFSNSDAYRMNGRKVISIDVVNNEITLGNSLNETVNLVNLNSEQVKISEIEPYRLIATDGDSILRGLPIDVYPDLIEISYVKGVTSSIQEQLDSKQGEIPLGTELQYYRGDKTWQTLDTSAVPEGSRLYFTNARGRLALSFQSGVAGYNNTTGVISIPTNNNQLENGSNFITLESLSSGAGISYNSTTGLISSTITQYTDALARLSLGLTTNGNSGASTYNTATGIFNIPNYTLAGLGGEPAFAKNTAFNKNFGTIAGTVAEGNDSRILNGQEAFEWGNHASAGYWSTSGNTLADSATLGSLNNHNVVFKRNNIDFISLVSEGVQIDNLPTASTDTDRFLVSDSGIIKTRTGTQLLSDIGGFPTPTGLTAGTVPRWNGTALVNSSILDSGTVVTVPNILVSGLTPNQLVATDASDNLVSLSTATHPSLAELAHVKGVTSAIQTQINGKFNTPTGLTTGALTKWNGTTLVDAIQSDLTTLLAGSYILNGTTQQASSNLNISGSGTFGNSVNIISPNYVQMLIDQTDSAAMVLGTTSGTNNTFLNTLNNGSNHITGVSSFRLLFNGTETVRFRSDGNVGFGTTNPQANLTLASNFTLGWQYTAGNSFIGHSITAGGLNPINFKWGISSNAAAPAFTFEALNGNNVVTILNGGNVLIGSQTGNGFGRLQVTGNIYSSTLVAVSEAILKTTTTGVITRATGADIATLLGTSASANYIQNQNVLAQTGNAWINGTLTANVLSSRSNVLNGYARLREGSTSATGFIEFLRADNTRNGFIGSTNTVLTYRAENSAYHLFDGGNLVLGGATIFNLSSNLTLNRNITGAVDAFAVLNQGQVQGDVTNSANYFRANVNIATGANVSNLFGFMINQGVNNGTVVNQTGFFVNSNFTSATNNYGFRSFIPIGTGRWNLFLDGTAQNHFRGNVGIGSGSTVPTTELDVIGTTRTTNLRVTNGAIVGRYWVCTNTDGTGAWTALGSSGYLGTWNANTNTPTIANGTGTAGTFYIVSVAGTWNGITFAQNDQVWYNGTTWQHVPTGISLPIASASVLGGIIVGSGLNISSGVLSVATLNQNTTGSAATLTTSRNIAITGDIAWNVDFNGSANVTAAGTLATVNANVGTFNNVTVNAKGLVTAASNISYLTANQNISITGDATGSGTTAIGLTLATVNANIGQFTKLTVNGKGLVTAATNLVESDIPSLSISKITGLQTTLDGLVINGLGFVKADGTTLSYDNREFVDTTSDQPSIAGEKRFSGNVSLGSSRGSLLRLEVVGTGSTPSSLSSSINGAIFVSDPTNTTGMSVGVHESSGFAGNTSISYFQARDRIGTGNSWNISLNPLGGNVGIGLLTALERLHVSGNIRYSGTLRPNGSQGTSGQFLRNNGSGVVDSWATIGHADIPNLDASKITTGTFADARIASAATWNAKQNAISGTGFVKASGTTLSYDNREFVDTSTNQLGIAGEKRFSSDLTINAIKVGTGVRIDDTRLGFETLLNNSGNEDDEGFNIAIGHRAMRNAIEASYNIAIGSDSLLNVTTGFVNIGIGLGTLRQLTTGYNNITIGDNAGNFISTGYNNTIIGNNIFGLANLQNHLIIAANNNIRIYSNDLGHTSFGNVSPTERLDITGNIKYSGTLKPSNQTPSSGQFLKATSTTANSWATIGHADITNLASFTGFDSRYLQANQAITLTGEVTGSGTTSIATAIANNAVVTAKINDLAITTAKVNNSAITYAKIQNVAADRLLGRLSTLGVVQELTNGQVKTFLAIGHADISNLSTYTGFDSRYSPIVHNHTLDSLSNVTITNKATGNFTRWNGTAWINTNLVSADIPNLSTDKLTSGILPISRGGTGRDTVGTAGQLVRVNSFANGLEYFTHNFTSNLGTVTSVGLSAPTGFVVANTPVTTSGVLTLNFAAGYSLPLTAKQTQWDAAFGWGNHAGLYSLLGHTHTFASLINIPTTIAGYGITDYNSLWETRWATKTTTNLPEGTQLYFNNTRARQAISLTTLGTSGVANYNNTTGVLNVPNYTLAGLGGEPLFSKNTAFNKNFGTTAGTVAEGNHVHTIGQITNLQNSLNDKQSILPTGSTAQLLTWDGVGHNYMNLELKTHFLRRNRIAVGNDYNSLDSHGEFTYDGYGTINIYRGGDFSRIASFGLIYGTNNSLLKATGGDLILSGNNIRINNFANATTTRMVVVDGNGFLSTQAIPTGGSGTTTPTLDIVASQTTGQFNAQLINMSGAGYMFRNDNISQSLSGMNLTNGDLQIIAFENRKLELIGHTEVRISNFSNNNNKLRIDTTVVDHKGTIYRFDKQSAFGGDYTPQTGDKVLFTFNGTEFVQQKLRTKVLSDGETYLIL